MAWFLYDIGLRHERVKCFHCGIRGVEVKYPSLLKQVPAPKNLDLNTPAVAFDSTLLEDMKTNLLNFFLKYL